MKISTTSLIVILVLLIGLLTGIYFISAQYATPLTSATATQTAVSNTSTIPMQIVSIHETATFSPIVNVEYPQFSSLPAAWNKMIASSTTSRLANFRAEVASSEAARKATGDPLAELAPSAYSFIASWQPAQINGHYISFIERYDSYSGGANGHQELQTFNFDEKTGMMMTLADLFPNQTDWLTKLSALAKSQLTDTLTQASNGHLSQSILDDGTAPVADNFQNFTFTDYAITIYFPKYAVAPGVFGEQHVTIPRNN